MVPNESIDAGTWVVVAAYNEASAIAETVAGVMAVCRNIVVCDDCSSDETAARAHQAGAHIVTHPINLGQGAALQTAISYALRQGAQYIVTFDADGQHNAAEIPPMLAALKAHQCDVVLGSRFLGKAENITWQRRLLLQAALLFTRLNAGIKLTDVHNGFRVLSRSFCQTFEFGQNRMAHASEILHHIARHHVRYIEHPVTILYSEYSVRKGQKGSNAVGILMELLLGRIGR